MTYEPLAEGRAILESISARLTQDQYAALHNAIEEGRHFRSRLAASERLAARLRSRLARVLRYAHAWSAHMGTGVWSRRFSVSGGGRR